MKKILILLFLAVNCSLVGAQTIPLDSTTVNTIDDFGFDKIELPPVEVFLEAAKSYADMKYLDEKVTEEKLLLKISRKEWLNYFRLQGNYQYGTNSSYLLQSGSESLPPLVGESSSRKVQSWYNAGVTINVPLDDVFARRNKNQVVRSRIRQIEYEAIKTLENRQLLILESYNNVVKNMSLLKVRAEAIALYNAQMKISERDFANGRIDIITLSLERSRRATAAVQYEEVKADLYNAVTVLEMLTKVKIINR
ncbi:MAG: TolC family protein [Mucinivorans sp.]